MVREILQWPHPKLEAGCRLVDFKFDADRLKALIADLTETCLAATGLGLAAPQIGSDMAVLVVDVTEAQDGKRLTVFINPIIVKEEGTQTDYEGCLSVPGEAWAIERALTVDVAYTNPDGTPGHLTLTGHPARAIQHEIDHLRGVCYPDLLSTLKKDIIRRKMKKVAKSIKREREAMGRELEATEKINTALAREMGFD